MRTSPLSAYVAAARRQCRPVARSNREMYSDIRVEPLPPDGIEYRYTFATFVDPSAGADCLSPLEPDLYGIFTRTIAPEMSVQLGIARPTATWTFLNPDRSLVWTRTFATA